MLPSELPEPAAPGGRTGVPDLSVIVVNLNTRELLRDCLTSIRALPDEIRWELIVVDNGSSDGSAEMVRSRFPEVRLIENPVNTGYAHPNNQGIAVSRGRYVLLLNSDTMVRPFALGQLVRFMDSHPEAGACGPTLVYPNGELQRSCYSFPSPRTYFARMFGLDTLFPTSRWVGNLQSGFDHRHTAAVDAILGAALQVRREVIDTVGPLDEQFRIHYNDFDWCYRIHQAGWRTYYVHDAEIVHYSQATTRIENQQLRIQGELVRNLFDYFHKHFGNRGVRWLRLWMLLGFGGRYLVFSVVDRLRPGRGDPVAARFRLGMVWAAWTGDPEQFGVRSKAGAAAVSS